MRILFGVQATGNGHISRARSFARSFANHPDIQVDWLFSGREREQLFDMQIFGDFKVLPGLTFVTSQGQINPIKTARKLNLPRLWKDVTCLDLDAYDLVISDFEPVTAWAAKHQGVPSMSISHQAAFLKDIPCPKSAILNKPLMRYFAPTDVQLGLHWDSFGQNLLPPVIEPMTSTKIQHALGDFALVYLPFEHLDQIQGWLAPIRAQEFVCFHPDIERPLRRGNVRWRPLSREGFIKHLHACQGVITNAGFELPSEAIALGKKLLARPLKGQFEQQANAMALQQLGYGYATNKLSSQAIKHWLQQPNRQLPQWPNVSDAIVEWLKIGDWQNLDALSAELWSQVGTVAEEMRVASNG
ncbi:MJ1255/VC2487 family glycosyltransferase [Paraferrimonas sedimenticola]|uniref:Glycosyl transferase n=1 Tax=Paraferrimonas sedimenticola TaxID=375674 RepID=A0AA37RX17_9GAMM|nr:MJ1255/VC2487 family glycosyltransferase [Paraferrimonas sedimenticola]GLP96934.1 glycosyl transferase [Paraferrimonas sedimenticola]